MKRTILGKILPLAALVLAGCEGDVKFDFRPVPEAGDLKRAQSINDRIYPTAQCFYGAPATDMHNRMKEALVMLGRLPKAVVRPPLTKLTEAELATVRDAIEKAGLSYEGADILQRAA